MYLVNAVTRSASSLVSKHALKRLAATAIGLVGMSLLALQIAPVSTAAASPAFTYRAGYSVQHGWLCYGWNTGALHCTQNWHSSNGQYISGNPGWVPSSGAVAVSTSAASSTSLGLGAGAIAGISQWSNPGRGSYAMGDYAGDPYSANFGQCTWYAKYRNSWQPLSGLGNAWQWAYNAPSHGLRTGGYPVAGATVVFQPYVQGAGSLGHVAHVEAVYGGGWFLISEMNFYWNGGGWGRVDYRYAHSGSGVSFIYA